MVRRVMKILAWTLGLPVGVLLIGFVLLAMFVDAPSVRNAKVLPEYYDIQLNEQKFSYSPSYAIIPDFQAYSQTSFVISVLLPDFSPKTIGNAKYFDTHKYGQRTVRIRISSVRTELSTLMERLRNSKLFPFNLEQQYPEVIALPSDYGLVSYGQKYNGKFDVFGEEIDGKLRTLFSCYVKREGQSPICHQSFIYDNDIVVRIAYSRRYLANWQEHEKITIALLNSFEKRAALRIKQGVFRTRKKTEEKVSGG